ncbi:amidohydrolase : Putative TIM-barrel fold metal-dependent hydrolase OS=Singulisphaera acidiphila (strain ATCC BAA-1392 / DSM 18658 / VKM B-2454 / MOB10) GN=Sinac_6486 PE=4 SV=1: Amidohydro_3 [Gemmataceae bacterium]|nr:amidohydrolase : Putative TIM-barrel fold metal-dependent hydrolase OS=Singulisphaera acidiphila (strain ATCC BAA-1392 / DSM 18658 / VKM B-2454 / MOB10) GN=Sinac_6486 PE=4 SV=1: Amidohydro_3 [Gemmataceae bacterium]VTT99179.1 amidohydrolase : Putative TIM-barrel fold metal-dependent hydrolase OS=Singulisphaera acidiphila (strain ATCC BAA-1392 / DSM 18658 / VKM B-2454 / MOB10) GN=Sinac_6486 PE=4 SV=1: Amidohydro_3 [Gemmataceae bacterium]
MKHLLLAAALLTAAPDSRADDPADLIVHNAKVATVDPKFTVAEAVAVRGGKIAAVGTSAEVMKLKGDKTRVVDVGGMTVLPGLYDSHVHPVGAALSEVGDPVPLLRSIPEVLEYITKRAADTPEGQWIVIRYAFPTRLKEARFPTKAELDVAAPKHPVLYHAGPAGVTNTMGLKVSGVTKDTKNPGTGVVVKDPVTGEPTGMLRSAYGVLKGVPSGGENVSPEKKRAAVRKLFSLYNEHGITSVSDRNAGRGDLDLYLALKEANELTVRVNVARGFSPGGTREEIAKRLDDLPGKDGRGGPTGGGDEWVRIGPIKMFTDGGMLNGTAYMRKPWPKGDTYQVTEDDYRGLLFAKAEQLQIVAEEAAKRKWAVTSHTAGEGAMDVLLDAYETADRITPIKDLRFCITHANFPSQHNLERCRKLGVCADVQPAWLYKDGHTLLKVLGPERMRWFQPYKSWTEYTTIGGGSDHMLRFDPLDSTNPWSPWLGVWAAVTRKLERGGVLEPAEALTREQAIRLYTINNAYLGREEKEKGSLEVGKLADLIVTDRDVLTCPVDDLRDTKVVLTVVGGKVVFERK